MRIEFGITELTLDERQLQTAVREFCDRLLPRGTYEQSLGMSGTYSRKFSRSLAEQGWVGMAIPPEYGGAGRSTVDRLLVVEELLRRGAPLGYHMTADRQSGPLICVSGVIHKGRVAAANLSW